MGRGLTNDIGYIEEADVLLPTEGNIGMRKGRSNARLSDLTPPLVRVDLRDLVHVWTPLIGNWEILYSASKK